jgi:hypothetical protein
MRDARGTDVCIQPGVLVNGPTLTKHDGRNWKMKEQVVPAWINRAVT